MRCPRERYYTLFLLFRQPGAVWRPVILLLGVMDSSVNQIDNYHNNQQDGYEERDQAGLVEWLFFHSAPLLSR